MCNETQRSSCMNFMGVGWVRSHHIRLQDLRPSPLQTVNLLENNRLSMKRQSRTLTAQKWEDKMVVRRGLTQQSTHRAYTCINVCVRKKTGTNQQAVTWPFAAGNATTLLRRSYVITLHRQLVWTCKCSIRSVFLPDSLPASVCLRFALIQQLRDSVSRYSFAVL
jgi:hypothetical protein